MPQESSHILGNFQKALDALNADLKRMSKLVVQSTENSIRGLLARDSGLCAQVIADDEEIDSLEMKVDREGLDIIMLYQPVASDLRQVVSTMKVSSNLERVGDQTVNIAKRARKLNKSLELPEARLIEPLYEQATGLLRRSLEAFGEGNLEAALEVKDQDKQLNKSCKSAAKQLTRRMEEDPSRIRDYLDLQFVVRFLERIGDHAKNISEDAVFAEAAVDIRHGADRAQVKGMAEEDE